MRIAALAFGILAGLVASFILALGGLDAAELVRLDGRQMQLIDFGLFVVANLGVLGAGLVLAAPLAGLVLFVLGAAGWLAAAIVLRHGPDYVMLTPPAILVVAALLAAVALFRRGRTQEREEPEAEDDDRDDQFDRRRAAPVRRAAPAAVPRRLADEVDEPAEPDDDADDRGSVSVGASFFGESGTAMPLRGAMPPSVDEELLRGLGRSDRQPADQRDWQPVRRRVEPPRQKPMFRPPEDEYDDEESGFAQFARVASSVLSFGLYAALAASALLVVFNLQQGAAERPTATRIEPSTAAPAAPAPVLAPSSASEAVAEAPANTVSLPPIAPPSEQPAAPVLAGPSGLAVPAAGAAAPVIATAPSIPAELPAPGAQPQQQQPFAYPGVVVADGPSLDGATEPPPASDETSASDASASDAAAPTDATPVPFPMPAAIAAQRAGGVGRTVAPSAQRTEPAARTDTGL